jgi:prepilin peptidase CpaA
MGFAQVAALSVALLGCVTDLWARRVPNVLTFGAAAGAFGYYLAGDGWTALGWSALGWVTGAAVFLPFFALRGLGGGDVKLLAAIGAWLGPGPILWVALWAGLVGGPLALFLAFSRGYARQAFVNLWGLFSYWRAEGLKPHPGLSLETAGSPRLPYAVPIAAGVVIRLWLQ